MYSSLFQKYEEVLFMKKNQVFHEKSDKFSKIVSSSNRKIHYKTCNRSSQLKQKKNRLLQGNSFLEDLLKMTVIVCSNCLYEEDIFFQIVAAIQPATFVKLCLCYCCSCCGLSINKIMVCCYCRFVRKMYLWTQLVPVVLLVLTMSKIKKKTTLALNSHS